MRIEWLGHSAFKLTESTGTTLLTDPFDGDLVGYPMGDTGEIDVVTISHKHADHNYLKGVSGDPLVINRQGAFEVAGVHISSIATKHDDKNGELRGNNIIFKYRMDGVDVCHLGDIGEPCNINLIELIGSVDILLIPVGGNYTIDAEQAKEYVDLLMPDIVIPMHYKSKGVSIDIDKLDAFLKLFDDSDIIYNNCPVDFDRTEFEGENTKVLVFV